MLFDLYMFWLLHLTHHEYDTSTITIARIRKIRSTKNSKQSSQLIFHEPAEFLHACQIFETIQNGCLTIRFCTQEFKQIYTHVNRFETLKLLHEFHPVCSMGLLHIIFTFMFESTHLFWLDHLNAFDSTCNFLKFP